MRLAGAASQGQGMHAPRPGARQGGPRCGGGEEEEEEEEEEEDKGACTTAVCVSTDVTANK